MMLKDGSATYQYGASFGDYAVIKPGVLVFEQVVDRILRSGLYSDTIQGDPRRWLAVNFKLRGKSRAEHAAIKDESDIRRMLNELLPLAEPLNKERFSGLLESNPLFPAESEALNKSGGRGTTVPTIRFPRSFQEGVSLQDNASSITSDEAPGGVTKQQSASSNVPKPAPDNLNDPEGVYSAALPPAHWQTGWAWRSLSWVCVGLSFLIVLIFWKTRVK